MRARIKNAKISLQNAVLICKKLRGKKLTKAEKFLNDLYNKKISLNGKYYTKTVEKFLELLKLVKSNAKQKDLDINRLWIKKIKADKGERRILAKSRFKFRGRRGKSTHLYIEVEER